jgi:hypothetical protein
VIKSERFGWAEPVTRLTDMRNEYQILFGIPDSRLGDIDLGWENIKMVPKGVVTEDVDWIELTQRNGHSCRLM